MAGRARKSKVEVKAVQWCRRKKKMSIMMEKERHDSERASLYTLFPTFKIIFLHHERKKGSKS